ncbi:MAG: (Fe-S)-binding protein [Candidatus Bathyarchaeia archaeon]
MVWLQKIRLWCVTGLTDHLFLSLKNLDGYKLINMETCTRCATCAHSCPAYTVTREDYAVPAWKSVEFRRLLNRQRGFLSAILGQRPIPREWLSNISTKGLYLCTLCGRCMPGCVFTIQNLELWEALRSIIHEEGEASPSLLKIADSLEKNMNPYSLEHSERLNWVKELGPKGVKEGQRAKTLYYVGCTSSYQEKTIASSTANILSRMNEDWSLFGKDEWCCGDPHIAVGDRDKAEEFIKHNLEVASSLGASRIVTSCAHCYRMWRWKYLEVTDRHGFEVLHITEYLQECLKSGALRLGKLAARVTYHDPCYLSRLGGVVDEPRNILNLAVENFVEMRERKFDTFCCGGGAMTEVVDQELWAKIGDERFRQAEIVKADFVVSGCPFCRRSLTQAARRSGSKMQILDIVELVAKQLKD